MTAASVIVRETAISVVINMMLSAAFYVALFGLGRPVAMAMLANDFFPQSFMVALMSALVPSLLMRRRVEVSLSSIVVTSVLLALSALVIIGGTASRVAAHYGGLVFESYHAMAMKMIFGALLAGVVTPLSLSMLFARTSRS